jgi:beta-mannosidase
LDYARANGFAEDWQFADNFHKFDGLEDCYWKYRTILTGLDASKENYFVAHGIDYKFDILLDGEKIYSYEGMFAKTRVSLAQARENSVLEVLIYPAPKNPVDKIDALDESRIPMGRTEADRSVKPAVCYGWDFHPRLIVQGIWDEAYIETVQPLHIANVAVDYEVIKIDGERGSVNIRFEVEKTGGVAEFNLYNDKGELIAVSNTDTDSLILPTTVLPTLTNPQSLSRFNEPRCFIKLISIAPVDDMLNQIPNKLAFTI